MKYPIYILAVYYKEGGYQYYEFRSLIGAVQTAEALIDEGHEVSLYQQMMIRDFETRREETEY